MPRNNYVSPFELQFVQLQQIFFQNYLVAMKKQRRSEDFFLIF